MSVTKQHLIDPEICIRCNTCEEICPINAITNDGNNYVVDSNICNLCMDCISPCPTGSIDNWHFAQTPFTIDDQYSWDELPEQDDYDESEVGNDNLSPDEANDGIELETNETQNNNEVGKVRAPFSAAHPYINMYGKDDPIIAKVTGNLRITDTDSESDIHHIILDFDDKPFPVLEGQSIGILPPGRDEKGRDHLVRLYSVASPRDGERPDTNNLSLTVKRVLFEENGETVSGVGSNYVCDLERGSEVKITGPFGSTFLMPNHKQAHIIMICTGTGSAPFRGMTEYHRRHLFETKGSLTLYFGARTPGELPYFGPLEKLSSEFIDKQLVFSRLQDKPKEYVQDRMIAQSAKLGKILPDSNTYIYICGLKSMEEGVEKAFEKICAEHGQTWSKLKLEMQKKGRYHVETY